MAAVHEPVFAQKYKTNTAVVTAALTGIGTDSPTGMQQIAVGGTNGSLVSLLSAMPRATVALSSLVLYIVKASAPTVYRLIDSEVMAAYTLAATTAIPETNFGNISVTTPRRLETGDILYVGSQVALAAGIVFYAEVNDL
jgi:hypothetical protein